METVLILKLSIVFLVIVAVLWRKLPLFAAMLAGLLAVILLYGIQPGEAFRTAVQSVTSFSTISLVLSFYFITFLQRMLERRGRLKQAEEALSGMFHNRRVNASFAPAVIGLLPSAGAMTICAGIVEAAAGSAFSREDLTCVTSFYRHIPESFLPTYTSILIALSIAGVSAGTFVIAMLPMVAALFLIGYYFYLRRLPKEIGDEPTGGRSAALRLFCRSLWSIVLIVFLIIALGIPVYVATPIAATLNYFVDRFQIKEILPMFGTALEPVLICNTVLIMIFKDMLNRTGSIDALPSVFGALPLPLPLIFVLLFFFGTIVTGSSAIIPLCYPMAMAAIPHGGVGLLVLLMSISYAAMQISPTHVCLFIAADYFKVSFGQLIRRNVPMVLIFSICAVGYACLLGVFSS